VLRGEPFTLSWEFSDAESAYIDKGIGTVHENGSETVWPESTVTYTVTAVGTEGTSAADVTVRVTDADLEPLSISLSQKADTQTLELTGTAGVTIANNGTTAVVRSYEVLLFEDMNSTGAYEASADHVIGRAGVSKGPEGGDTLELSIDLRTTLRFANNRIFAVADPWDNVRETDEENNVTHTLADCELRPPSGGEFNPELEWQWPEKGGEPEYGPEDSYHVICAPVVANLTDDNGDGMVNENDIPDIIFQTYTSNHQADGVLRAVSGDTGREWSAISDAAHQTNPSSTPAVGDIDNDGFPEIVAVHESGWIMAFENDGSPDWRLRWTTKDIGERAMVTGNSGKVESVTLADIDEDGSPEVIVGRLVLNSDGSKKWDSRPESYGKGNSCVADMDLRGHPELIVGNAACFSDGTEYWRNTDVADGFAAVGNLDDDRYPEIVVVGNGKVWLLEHTGRMKWEEPAGLPGGGYGGPPTIADFDNDGDVEIGVAGARRYVVFESDGTEKWQTETEDTSSGITGSSVFDFEGDGNAEVVYADEVKLRIYDGETGNERFGVAVGSGTRSELPVIADVDNDNNAEIVVVANNHSGDRPNHGIFVFGDRNDTWVSTRRIWNQHSYHITNVEDDGTIPRVETNNWEVFNSYRQNGMLNPFGCTDLSASHIRADDSDFPDSVRIIARIGNAGVLHTTPGTEISFYDGPPGSGSLLGTVTTENRTDPGGYEDVIFQWESPPRGILTVYAGADDDGTGQGGVMESDEGNNIASATLSVGNNAPTADAGPDQEVSFGTAVSPDGTGSRDADGDPLTYEWSLVSVPDGSAAEISDPGIPAPSFSADRIGEYHVQLVVSDNIEESGVSMAVITSAAEGTPLDVVPDISGDFVEGAEIVFSVSLSEGITCEWNFGDGTASDGPQVTHVYDSPGEYTLMLRVRNEDGIVNEITRHISIAAASGPVAVFSVSGSGVRGENILFDASGSHTSGAGPLTYAWDFGGSETASDPRVLHIYNGIGERQVRLTVTDESTGRTATAEMVLNITPNRDPEAAFGYSGQMRTGEDIRFDASASYDPEGHGLDTYTWDFGDGSVTEGQWVSHSFGTDGDHTVTLTVTDNTGRTGTFQRILRIASGETPLPGFELTGTGLTGHILSFDAAPSAASGDHEIVSYEWDFGDGVTSRDARTDHVYQSPGQFTVTLRVTDDAGGWAEISKVLTIGNDANKAPELTDMTAPAAAVTGMTARFHAAGTDPNFDPLTFIWDFGDGSETVEGSPATHTYESPGDYDILVTVSDGRGGAVTERSRISITDPPAENVPPVAEAGLPCQGDVADTVRFDGSGSYDLNGDTLTYLWDFGDNSTGTGISPDHIYLSGGVREVTLTVTDPSGLAHTDTAEVRITDPDDVFPPVPSLELEECPDIYDMHPVYGTISDTNPVTYRLQHREKGASDWITFAEGSGESFSGLLGVFDPTMVRNGVHEIRLYTEDMSGNRSDITYPVIVDGNLKSAYAGSVSGEPRPPRSSARDGCRPSRPACFSVWPCRSSALRRPGAI